MLEVREVKERSYEYNSKPPCFMVLSVLSFCNIFKLQYRLMTLRKWLNTSFDLPHTHPHTHTLTHTMRQSLV